jgi:hypothetical protein
MNQDAHAIAVGSAQSWRLKQMPRTQTITKQIFKYRELTKKAQANAREWWRSQSYGDEWHEYTIEDAAHCASLLGIAIYNPKNDIYFQVSSSQGDFASFEGNWSAQAKLKGDKDAAGKVKKFNTFRDAIKDHAPQDEELSRIAEELDRCRMWVYMNDPEKWPVSCVIKTPSYSNHRLVFEFADADWYGGKDDGSDDHHEVPDWFMPTVEEALKDFAKWIFKQLQQECEHYYSDENIHEQLTDLDCEFDEHGEFHG